MKTVRQSYLINSSIDKVWQALVDTEIIDDWGGGPAQMNDRVGAEFSLWGGDIRGKNIEVINPPTGGKKLVQQWQEDDWDNFSKVTFTLSEEGNKTKLDLLHEDIPDNEAKDIEDGWKTYYLGPLKELLENS